MEVVYERCAGLDVHKKSITACVLWALPKGKKKQEKRRFATFTQDLLAMADWLRESGVTHVAIAYASHCTSLGRCDTFSACKSRFDNLTPLALRGGLRPGSS